MMKFKSLFRRGQQSHSSHQKQQPRHRQNNNNQQNHTQDPSIETNNAAGSGVAWHASSPTDTQGPGQESVSVVPVASTNNKSNIPVASGEIRQTQSLNSSKVSTVPPVAAVRTSLPADYVSRMQEIEHENDILRKERARLEANLRNANNSIDAKRFDEQYAELLYIKEQHSSELERLAKENDALRSRLHDVVHSPLSDTEKQQLLDASRLHNSAPASIAVLQEDSCFTQANMTQETARSTTPDWDKRSSSSEVSVACLQDRILQMEETHYSTNEELQATIQELSDLQGQLNELQADNERLAEEKGVLLESLCRQTEKLEDSRTKVDTLQVLLLREEQPQESTKGYNTEREQKLVDLLKSAQEERESLLSKQEDLTAELKNLRSAADESSIEVERLTQRVHFLESTIDASNVERKLLDLELAETKQEGANRSIEISRLATLLENARSKIEELDHSRQLENKSEADEMLDAARREKDALETQAAALQEQLARSHCDHDRLKDQYSQLQEEYKVARNNAKSAIEDLEYRLSQMKDERISLSTELQLVRDSLSELQSQCQRHLEDKREMKAVLSDLQRREREAQTRLYEVECALAEERKLRQEESAEWEQFQTDLLMTVRVANDFKTEAQSELERVVLENKAQRDKLRSLEAQLDKLNNMANERMATLLSVDTDRGLGSGVRKPSTIFKRGRRIIRMRFEAKKRVIYDNTDKKERRNWFSGNKDVSIKEGKTPPLRRKMNFCFNDSSSRNGEVSKKRQTSPSSDLSDGEKENLRVKAFGCNGSFATSSPKRPGNFLRDITGFQNTSQDTNVSNSRFFVPNNHYSKLENSMDDLSFRVDPEMAKVLRESMEEGLEKTDSAETQKDKLNAIEILENVKIRKNSGRRLTNTSEENKSEGPPKAKLDFLRQQFDSTNSVAPIRSVYTRSLTDHLQNNVRKYAPRSVSAIRQKFEASSQEDFSREKRLSCPTMNLRQKIETKEEENSKPRRRRLAGTLSAPTQKSIPPPSTRLATTPTETQQSVLTSVQQEMAARRKANISRQDSRLSVKCLIESIENATKQAKAGPGSRSSSTSSLNSIGTNEVISLKTPLRDQQINNLICTTNPTNNNNKTQTSNIRKPYSETKTTVPVLTSSQLLDSATLNAKAIDFVRRNSVTDLSERKDPLCGLVKNGGSRRNALLKWCQNKTLGYRNIDITNFSSSWNDGLALCAILHSYLPDKVPYDSLVPTEKRRNFSIAFSAAESVGILTTLNIGDMCQLERPDWQQVMTYVTSIYKHFET